MNILSFVIITSLVIVALISFGLPAYYESTKDVEVKAIMTSSSSRNTILFSLVLPLCIGLSFAYMAAETAACGGWINPGLALGMIAGIVFSIVLIKLIPKLMQCKSKVVIGSSLLISFLLALSTIFLTIGLNSWDELDFYHHPIYRPIDIQWVNSIIGFIGRIFPMEDYPVIELENKVYSPEYSFVQTFSTVSEIAYTVVMVTSLYGVIKDNIKRTKNQ